MLPFRASPVLAATVKPTAPLPPPELPLEIEIHGADGVAVQVQAESLAVSAIVPVPPADGTEASTGEIEYVQGGGGAAWLTVNVCPAIIAVPRRAAPVFASTVNVATPGPVPLAPLATPIQGSLLDA